MLLGLLGYGRDNNQVKILLLESAVKAKIGYWVGVWVGVNFLLKKTGVRFII